MPKQIYQLKITLQGLRPPIWRRILVDGATPLNQLHRIIQVMGWTDSHLHAFRVGENTYGEPDPDYGDDWTLDERKIKLQKIASLVGNKFHYEYDMGDGWMHLIQLEKIAAPEPNTVYPVCIKGKRTCPPEDCGGVWGYADLIEIMADPKHEQYEEMQEWLGSDLNPEKFDIDAVNDVLRQL